MTKHWRRLTTNFTFQYVSINTRSRKPSVPCQLLPLHSNMFLLIPFHALSKSALLSAFTFQYVSINTGHGKRYYEKDCNFTFQYVSINTNLTIIWKELCYTLHSNMFLLILIDDNTCQRRNNFTFQYVSINTPVEYNKMIMRTTLHSNMFLLIHKGTDSNVYEDLFTFQYVSINTWNFVF